MANIRNILVPVDFSLESEHALQSAIALAQERTAQLTVLHVLTSKEYGNIAARYFTANRGRPLLPGLPVLDIWLREKSSELHNFIQRVLRQSSETVIREKIEIGNPANTIISVAREDNADLIVLAVKHGSLFYRMSHSILLKVAFTSGYPVLLISSAPERAGMPCVAPA